jgi:hypothetical protein
MNHVCPTVSGLNGVVVVLTLFDFGIGFSENPHATGWRISLEQ